MRRVSVKSAHMLSSISTYTQTGEDIRFGVYGIEITHIHGKKKSIYYRSTEISKIVILKLGECLSAFLYRYSEENVSLLDYTRYSEQHNRVSTFLSSVNFSQRIFAL